MMFDIYTKTVVIDKQEYELRPLSGRFLPKLYKVFARIDAGQKEFGEDGFLQTLDEPTVTAVHELCLETMRRSYPDKDPVKVEEFVTQNLWAVFQGVSEVNLPKKE